MSDAEPILDPDVLDANTMSNRALQRELFDLYFGQAPQLLGRMRSGLSDGARSDWRDSAHGLKGTARTLGLTRVAAAALSAERAQPDEAMLDDLQIELARASAEAYAYLAAQDAA